MDTHYDVSEARNTLEQLAIEGQATNKGCLAKLAQNSDWKLLTEIIAIDQPKSWRLVKKTLQESTIVANELVFTIRGIITAKELSPIFEKSAVGQTRMRFLLQGITITGLGTPTFQRSVDAAKHIYELFQHQYSEGKLESWSPGMHREFPTLEMSNRYFTLKRDAPNMEHVPFDKLVDPFGMDDRFRIYAQGGEYETQSFDIKGPQIFRIGDIVEAQVSFIVVPLKGQNKKMHIILHAIALINGQLMQDAQTKRMAIIRPSLTLKRKIGYEGTNKRARLDLEGKAMEGVDPESEKHV